MRILAGFIIFMLAIYLPPLVVLPMVVLHALSWFAIELVFFAALIDAYFGIVSPFPYYTMAAILLVLCVEYIKPYLTFYSD